MPESPDVTGGGAPSLSDKSPLPGKGLLRGLAVTLKTMTRRAHTQQYPEVEPELPPRSRGVIALLEENCTSCMLCARECPDWCIYIDSHKETVKVSGGRPRQRNVLDRFAIDFSLCMYCGICVEVCPFDALYWSPEFEYAEYDIRNLLHEKSTLGEWMVTVPPPPAHDPNGEPSKEQIAVEKAAARAAVVKTSAGKTAAATTAASQSSAVSRSAAAKSTPGAHNPSTATDAGSVETEGGE